MTKKQDNVTLELLDDVPIPSNGYRGGKAKELAESMKPGKHYLVETRSQAVSIGNALKRLGCGAVIRKQKEKKTGKVQGYRIWRSY